MRSSVLQLAVLSLACTVRGDLHQLFVGTFSTDSLYTLEFDDSALTLSLIQNTTTAAASSWVALSHDKKNLYGTDFNGVASFVSYTINNATSLKYDSTLPLMSNCSTSKSIFVVAQTVEPYAVYGTPFGGDAYCGTVMSVDSNGVLSEVIQNYTYATTSGVHGMALNSANTYLYSADDTDNSLWTHSVNAATGELTQVAQISGPVSGANPRHIAVHPKGLYAYVILEGANELAVYSIDQTTHTLAFTNITYPLIPSTANSSLYWSDEVAISYSTNYLWATSRARSTDAVGYISAFTLSDEGVIGKQLFLNETTSSGGTANSVAPSDFTDKWVALTDSEEGFVEIWELVDGNATKIVAHLDLADGGCCANAVWYS